MVVITTPDRFVATIDHLFWDLHTCAFNLEWESSVSCSYMVYTFVSVQFGICCTDSWSVYCKALHGRSNNFTMIPIWVIFKVCGNSHFNQPTPPLIMVKADYITLTGLYHQIFFVSLLDCFCPPPIKKCALPPLQKMHPAPPQQFAKLLQCKECPILTDWKCSFEILAETLFLLRFYFKIAFILHVSLGQMVFFACNTTVQRRLNSPLQMAFTLGPKIKKYLKKNSNG
jgi:hypothetical protein